MTTQARATKTKQPMLRVAAHYFCGLLGEAIFAVVQAHRLKEGAMQMRTDGDDTHGPDSLLRDSGVLARYAFLLPCNALENSAYSVLANCGKLSQSLTDEIDKLNTFNKFEVFALVHGKLIDRGDGRYGKAKQVIKCRNELVHPKGLDVLMHPGFAKAEPRLVGGREYPSAFDFGEVEQAVTMIGDILGFIGWVVFDVCRFSPKDGHTLINGAIQSWTSDLDVAHELWKYDLRSLRYVRDWKVKHGESRHGKKACQAHDNSNASPA
jgi:hypothetical protein